MSLCADMYNRWCLFKSLAALHRARFGRSVRLRRLGVAGMGSSEATSAEVPPRDPFGETRASDVHSAVRKLVPKSAWTGRWRYKGLNTNSLRDRIGSVRLCETN